MGAARQFVEHEGEFVDEHRGKGLHALDGLAAADRVEQLGQLGELGEQRLRLGLHLGGQQQFAAR